MADIETITIRKATQKDAADLAIIDNMSSHGMSLAFWQHAVKSGEAEDPLVFARERFADKSSVFGWNNALIAENGKEVLGAVTLYEMTEPDEDVDEIKRVFPDFIPVFDLFAEAVGDWFVDSLGVFPLARGTGIGRKLLSEGLKKGSKSGFKSAGLVVESNNASAVALYKAQAFEVVKSLPMTGTKTKGDWLLMKAEI